MKFIESVLDLFNLNSSLLLLEQRAHSSILNNSFLLLFSFWYNEIDISLWIPFFTLNFNQRKLTRIIPNLNDLKFHLKRNS